MVSHDLPKRPSPPVLSPSERFSRILNEPSKLLARLNLPPELAVETYPGRPRPHKDDFRHRLYNLLRLAFLHQLSHLDQVNHVVLANTIHPRNAQKFPLTSELTSVSLRLHGPKIMAVPGELSLEEYARLARWMIKFCHTLKWWDDFTKWVALDHVWRQCLACPRLLDYVPE